MIPLRRGKINRDSTFGKAGRDIATRRV